MSEELVVDMSDVEDYEYDDKPVPTGWYQCLVKEYREDKEVGPDAKKLAEGTKGTNWFLQVVEGEHKNRMFFANYWHDKSAASFFKGLYKASGAFTPEELDAPMDILAERDRVVGTELWVKVVVKKAQGTYPAGNDVKAFKHLDEYENPDELDADEDLMP